VAATYPNPTDPFANAINDLLGLGMDLLGRIKGALLHKTTEYLPKNLAKKPETAEARVTRAMDWLYALTRTLAGDRFYLPTQPPKPTSPPRSLDETPQPAEPAPPRPTRPKTPRTQEARELDQLRRIRKAFATQSIARIARRIYGAMGIRQDSDSWHHNLLAQAETPLQWNTRHRAAEQAFNAQKGLPSPSPTRAGPGWGAEAAETPAESHPPDPHPRQ
jgi:hypothetical protein